MLKKCRQWGHARPAARMGQYNDFMGVRVACASHSCPHWLAVSSLFSRATAVSMITDLLRTENVSHEAKLCRLMAVHALRLAQFQIFASAGQLTANSEVLQ